MVKKKKLKGKILIVGFLVFTIYAVISLVMMNDSIHSKKVETERLNAEILEKETLNKELQELLDKGFDEDYIVKKAREKLGLVFPEERVYVDISGK